MNACGDNSQASISISSETYHCIKLRYSRSWITSREYQNFQVVQNVSRAKSRWVIWGLFWPQKHSNTILVVPLTIRDVTSYATNMVEGFVIDHTSIFAFCSTEYRRVGLFSSESNLKWSTQGFCANNVMLVLIMKMTYFSSIDGNGFLDIMLCV